MEHITMEFQVKDFHLEHIFDCGQCFRWNREEDGSYVGTAGGRIARLKFLPAEQDRVVRGRLRSCTQGTVLITQAASWGQGGAGSAADEDARFWREYLDLERDYGKIKRALARGDKAMARAIREGEGIRLLKQDLWETMVSFIISQNNNIPRIKGCIEAVAAAFGKAAGQFEGRTYFELPAAQALAALRPEDLSGCRLGYRAPYLIETAKQVLDMGGPDAVEAHLLKLRDREGPEAVIEVLQNFAGVGPKVAGCIALFGVQNFRAFPLDVWMKRTMNFTYGFSEKDVKGMEDYARKHFAGKEGFAQQYLFYAARSGSRQ